MIKKWNTDQLPAVRVTSRSISESQKSIVHKGDNDTNLTTEIRKNILSKI